MINRIRNGLDKIRASYWFVPSLMSAGAAATAFALVWLDKTFGDAWMQRFDWIYSGGAEGARQLLATVAGAMITTAGVVFSVTIVALSMASNQFGPRLLRNFMRDRGNQVVLGTFIATYVYCLLVLRTIRGENDGEFVPQLSVTMAVLLSLVSVGVLIFFIHHSSVSMQAPVVIVNVGRELRETINCLFPEPHDADTSSEAEETVNEAIARLPASDLPPITAPRSGYIQTIDTDSLHATAVASDAVIHILHRPGHYVAAGDPLIEYWAAKVEEQLADQIAGAIIVGSVQTATQDFEFVANQLVEIAVRALSPGVNDPRTALNCIDQLAGSLCLLAERRIPSPLHYDDDGTLRLINYPWTFSDVCDCVLRPLRQHGRASAAVVVRLLETLTMVVAHTHSREDRATLLRHAQLIKQSSEGQLETVDMEDVEERYRRLTEMEGESDG